MVDGCIVNMAIRGEEEARVRQFGRALGIQVRNVVSPSTWIMTNYIHTDVCSLLKLRCVVKRIRLTPRFIIRLIVLVLLFVQCHHVRFAAPGVSDTRVPLDYRPYFERLATYLHQFSIVALRSLH